MGNVFFGSYFNNASDGNWNTVANWYSFPGFESSKSMIPATPLGRLPNAATDTVNIVNGVVTTPVTGGTYSGALIISGYTQANYGASHNAGIAAGTYSGNISLTDSAFAVTNTLLQTAPHIGGSAIINGNITGAGHNWIGGSAVINGTLTNAGYFQSRGAAADVQVLGCYINGNVQLVGDVISGGIFLDGNVIQKGRWTRAAQTISGPHFSHTLGYIDVWFGNINPPDYVLATTVSFAPTTQIPIIQSGGKYIPNTNLPADAIGIVQQGGSSTLDNTQITGVPVAPSTGSTGATSNFIIDATGLFTT